MAITHLSPTASVTCASVRTSPPDSSLLSPQYFFPDPRGQITGSNNTRTSSRRTPGLVAHVKAMPQRTVTLTSRLASWTSIAPHISICVVCALSISSCIRITHLHYQHGTSCSTSDVGPCPLLRMASGTKLLREVSIGQDSWPSVGVDHVWCVRLRRPLCIYEKADVDRGGANREHVPDVQSQQLEIHR